MTGRPHTLVVWGTSSGAGKSLLATALCRWAARRGLDVAPFKAQNMSNNARVVPHPDGGGGEIGSAQYWQALAARVVPTVDMNPVLLKPEGETASQVVLHGRVAPELGALPWRERSARLAAAAQQSLARLLARHELVVVEGAGSPAEINLADCDYVNLDAARWARAAGPLRALLVCDIDRGGAFAHLYGTWRLLPDDLRGHLVGFVLNKFRGDAALLAPGPQQLEALTGVPLAGVLPLWRDHGLPDEDAPAAFDAPGDSARTDTTDGGLRIAVVAPPGLSNLDEFEPLRHLRGVRLRWARRPADLAAADWVVLPGSKCTLADLAWLRAQRLDAAIAAHAAAGRPLLGVCGGLQMLGQTLHDPDGVDGGGAVAAAPGLGLLPLVTHFAAPKRLARQRARFAALAPPWQALDSVEVEGYEIRCGRTEPAAGAPADVVLRASDGCPIGWQCGAVLGLSLHGLFENPAVIGRLFGAASPALEQRLDALADAVERHLAAGLEPALA